MSKWRPDSCEAATNFQKQMTPVPIATTELGRLIVSDCTSELPPGFGPISLSRAREISLRDLKFSADSQASPNRRVTP
jgi:hypothetical protein